MRSWRIPSARMRSLRYPLNSRSRFSGIWLTVKYYGLPVDCWDRYPQEVAKVTPAEVQEIANKYIDLDHLQICVGAGTQIEGVLEKYGPVQVTDADGKLLKLSSAKAASQN